MDENPDVSENVVCDDEYDPSDCDCELCYYAREICEYIQDEEDQVKET